MITFGSLALLRPWWLLALPILLAVYLATKSRGGPLAGWDRASDPHLLAAMVARGGAAAGGRATVVPAVLLTLALGALALAGPAVRRPSQDRLRNLDATVIAMDVSQRMDDGGRLHQAAGVARDLLHHLGGRQAGLVVFAGDAYLASALTDFPSAIDTDLFALDDETVPDPGVRPDRALVLAANVLEEAHILAGDVVLITSGGGLEGTAAIRAAAALARAGRHVYLLEAGRLDARTAARADAVASAGNGFAVDLDHADRLVDTLSSRAIDRTGNSLVRTLGWRDFGRLILLLAAVPLLLGFRKAADA